MRVRLVFLGRLQDSAGECGDAELASGASIADLIDTLPVELRRELDSPRVRTALNGVLAARDAKLSHDDEIAFLPPVSGG